MKHDPSTDHTLGEEPPTKTEQNLGMLTAGGIALFVLGTTAYWVS